MTKQIPTWSDALLNVDPQAPNIHELKQNAIAQEIYELRTRLAEVEKDAARWVKARQLLSTSMLNYYLLEGSTEAELDEYMDDKTKE